MKALRIHNYPYTHTCAHMHPQTYTSSKCLDEQISFLCGARSFIWRKDLLLVLASKTSPLINWQSFQSGSSEIPTTVGSCTNQFINWYAASQLAKVSNMLYYYMYSKKGCYSEGMFPFWKQNSAKWKTVLFIYTYSPLY